MKHRYLLLVLALLLLLSGCIGPAGTESTGESGPTASGLLYPSELEQDFTVLCEWMDGIGFLPWMEMSGSFYLITKEPITEADISVQTGKLQWRVSLWEEEVYDGTTGLNHAQAYPTFLAYRDIKWDEMYNTLLQSENAFLEQYGQYTEDFDQKATGWYPEFYCYYVFMHCQKIDNFVVDGVYTETDLTVTVKGSTQVLEDVCRFSIYEDEGIEYPAQSGPLRMAAFLGSILTTFPTDEGYFYNDEANSLVAKEDLTITGARFLHAETAEFVKMELEINGVRMSWDGKTPVDVAAGETVELRFIAKDPALGSVLVSCAQRLIAIDYTCQGEARVCAYSIQYGFKPDAYECYAMANGRRDALYSYYADCMVKARGWHPDYVSIYADKTGETGNPFLDD